MRTRLPTALAITALSLAGEARAGSEPALLLPFRATLAIVERPARAPIATGTEPRRWRGPAPGAPPPPPEFIPKRIHIPDLYAVDFERDPPRFAEPVDADRMVALELVPAARRRPGFSLVYDTESLPIGDSSDRVSVRFQLPF